MAGRNDSSSKLPRSWAHVVERGRAENIIDHHEQHDDNNTPRATDHHADCSGVHSNRPYNLTAQYDWHYLDLDYDGNY